MEELYLNNFKVDINQGSVSRTFQINDLGELKNRQSNYSNNIKVPKTFNNKKIFDFLGVNGNTSRKPYENITAKYVLDGVELIKNGKCVIRNEDANFNIVIYDGNIEISDKLGSLQLKTLDFSAYNHFLTTTIFLNSFSNTSGYIYGLGLFWEGQINNEIAVNISTPCFYVHTLWDMIFNEAGYTTSGSFLQSSDFKSRVISMSNGWDMPSENKVLKQSFNNQPYNKGILDNTGSVSVENEYLLNSYVSTKKAPYKITFNGSVNVIRGENTKFIIYRNTTKKTEIEFDNGDINLSSYIDLNNGDVVNVYISSTSETNSDTDPKVFENIINPSFTLNVYEDTTSVNVKIEDLIGDTKRIDFVKDIMQRYCAFPRVDYLNKNIEFVQFKEISTDKANADDWSDKLSKITKYDFKSMYGQTTTAKYQYDSEYESYGDGSFEIDDVNIQETKTIFTSIYKASKTDGSYVRLEHFIGEDELEPNEDGLRIFKINTLNSFFFYKFNHKSVGVLVYSGSFPVLNFNQVSYDVELNNNYLEFASMQNDYKKITAEFNLNIIDIYNIDFYKLKYLKQTGEYYYLNKILNFKPNKLSKCELIKIGKDVKDPFSLIGLDNGSSTDSGTLTVLSQGSLTGVSVGTSTDSGTLTVISPSVGIQFNSSRAGVSSSGGSCPLIDWSFYHDGTNAYPQIGDIIYKESSLINTFNGGNLWYGLDEAFAIKIDGSGNVLDKQPCTIL